MKTIYTSKFKEEISFMRDYLTREDFADQILDIIKSLGKDYKIDFISFVVKDLIDNDFRELIKEINCLEDVKKVYMDNWDEIEYEDLLLGYTNQCLTVLDKLEDIANDFEKEKIAEYYE